MKQQFYSPHNKELNALKYDGVNRLSLPDDLQNFCTGNANIIIEISYSCFDQSETQVLDGCLHH